MRLPADRQRVERVLRVVALASLALWILNAARPRMGGSRRDVATDRSVIEALPRWTRAASLDSVHVQLDTVLDATSLAWLAALRGAGARVSWGGPWGGASISDVALETYPAADPAGGVFVLTSASPRTTRFLADDLGPFDTLAGPTAPVRLASVAGAVTLTADRQPARAEVASLAAPRRVFVTGAAGWEAKFVVAALEESGWRVDAHLFVAPDHDVLQGARAALHTSRYAAVVLLDSAGAESARGVDAFVRAGGGVVLAGDASRASRVAGLVAWRAGIREVAPLGTMPGDTAWRGMSRVPLDTLATGVRAGRRFVALERRSGRPIVAARRHYAGRVVAVGYDQTWRWRMAGGDAGPDAHRSWWSRAVASVAMRTPAVTTVGAAPTGAAPRALLYDVLGPPMDSVRVPAAPVSRAAIANVLGLLFLASLLAEWLLRRSRGAR